MDKLFSLIAGARSFWKAHRFLSAVIVLSLIGGAWWTYAAIRSGNSETRYVLATVERKTIVSSVVASGQVSASNQLDIKSKVSGDVLSLGVQAGDRVGTGALIASLDAGDAQKAVRDADVNLESAKLSLEKLQKPADALSMTQAENSLAKAQDTKQSAEDSLKKEYDDGFNNIAGAFLDLPAVMSGLQDILYGTAANRSQSNLDYYADSIRVSNASADKFRYDADTKYNAARSAYDLSLNNYKAASHYSDPATIKSLVSDTYEMTKKVAEAIKSANDLMRLYQDELTKRDLTPATISTTQLTSLNTYNTTVTTHLSALLSSQTSIQGDKDAITDADRSITENSQSLDKLKAGADEIDLQSAQLNVTKAQNALQDARNTLSNYSIRAPFPGTLAATNVKRYDSVGSGTVIATLITAQKIAELSLNEVDAAKIRTGDKATITFDAIDGLTLTGSVAEIDSVGTVSQGVVSYKVQIGFDSQDDRIKPGMTVNASIITAVHRDVLSVPSSAVKSTNGGHTVQVFDPPFSAAEVSAAGNQGIATARVANSVPVEVGISDDVSIEIISGLSEGQQVVARTSNGSASNAASRTSSNRGGFGGPGIRL